MPRAAYCILIASVWLFFIRSCDNPGNSASSYPHIRDLPTLSCAIEVRVGHQDDAAVGFTRIGDIAVSESGDVYVLETTARHVRVYSPDGTLKRTIGGPGDGPGEFVAPTEMGLLGDTLWVIDAMERISWFGPNGSLAFETPATGFEVDVGVPGVGLTVTPALPLPGGLIESSAVHYSVAGSTAAYEYPVVHFDREGRVVDTVAWKDVVPPATITVDGTTIATPSLQHTSPKVRVVGSDSVSISWSVQSGAAEGLIEVARVSADGRTLHRTALHYTPIEAPPSILDSLVHAALDANQRRHVNRGRLEAELRSAIRVPEHLPPVRDVRIGDDESVWIQLNIPDSGMGQWIVLDAQLRPRGRVGVPAHWSIEYTDGATAWAVATDDQGVPWLLRLAIQ